MLTLGRLTDDHDAGRHPGPDHEPDAPRLVEPIVQGAQDDLRLTCRLDGAERVIVVVDGQSEDGNDRVADDLLDRPAM